MNINVIQPIIRSAFSKVRKLSAHWHFSAAWQQTTVCLRHLSGIVMELATRVCRSIWELYQGLHDLHRGQLQGFALALILTAGLYFVSDEDRTKANPIASSLQSQSSSSQREIPSQNGLSPNVSNSTATTEVAAVKELSPNAQKWWDYFSGKGERPVTDRTTPTSESTATDGASYSSWPRQTSSPDEAQAAYDDSMSKLARQYNSHFGALGGQWSRVR